MTDTDSEQNKIFFLYNLNNMNTDGKNKTIWSSELKKVTIQATTTLRLQGVDFRPGVRRTSNYVQFDV